MNRLYEITDTLNAAWQMIEEQAEEDGSFDARLKLILDAVQEEFNDKIDGCCRILAEFDRRNESCKAEMDRLKKRAQSITNRTESLKNYMLDAMRATGQSKVETDLFTVAIRKNPPKVEILDEDDIPERFIEIRTEEVVRKKEIVEALKAGEEVPGCSLVQGERLDIK